MAVSQNEKRTYSNPPPQSAIPSAETAGRFIEVTVVKGVGDRVRNYFTVSEGLTAGFRNPDRRNFW